MRLRHLNVQLQYGVRTVCQLPGTRKLDSLEGLIGDGWISSCPGTFPIPNDDPQARRVWHCSRSHAISQQPGTCVLLGPEVRASSSADLGTVGIKVPWGISLAEAIAIPKRYSSAKPRAAFLRYRSERRMKERFSRAVHIPPSTWYNFFIEAFLFISSSLGCPGGLQERRLYFACLQGHHPGRP